MTPEEKAKYFCHTHPNLFSQQACNNCLRGMCYTCISLDEKLCPDCTNHTYKTGDFYKNLIEVRNIVLGGLMIALGYHIIQVLNTHEIYSDLSFLPNVFIALFYGLSVTGAFFLFNGTDILSEINKVPFFGFKLMLLVAVATVFLGLPVFYLLYKVFMLIKNRFLRQRN